MNRIVDWIFLIRLTGDMNIAGRRIGKIQPQDIHRKAVAIFRVWIRTLRGLRYPGIGSLSEYEPILKIFAIYSLIFSRAEYAIEPIVKLKFCMKRIQGMVERKGAKTQRREDAELSVPQGGTLQTNNCFHLLAVGGPPGVIQRRGVGRQRRNA